MKVKIFALLLACLMIFSLFPVTVLAVEDEHHHDCPGHGGKHTTENCEYKEIEVIPSQCGEYGYTLYLCLDCGEYFAENFNVVPGNHNWKETGKAVVATCTSAGKNAAFKCENCGKTKGGEEIAALGHDWKEAKRDGDCLTGGFIYYECSRCEETKKDPIEGTGEGHAWGKTPVRIEKEPKWNESGIAVYACETCNAEKKVVIWAEHDHVLKHCEKVNETCTQDGVKEYWQCEICKVCFADENASVVLEDLVIKAHGHDLENGKLKEEFSAVCDNPGWKKIECAICGEIVTEDIEAPGHTYEKEPIHVEPDCTHWGFDINACTVCGHVEKVNEINPLGHTAYDEKDEDGEYLSTDREETQPTCTKDGTRTWKCGRCGEAQSETVRAHGHDEVTVTVKATCSTFGYTFTYCNNADCDKYALKESYTENGVSYDVRVDGQAVRLISCKVGTKLDPNNHKLKEDSINQPTCTEAGNEVGYCEYCNEWYTKTLPALEHDFDASIKENVTVKQAQDCTHDEIIIVKCSRCNETQEQETKNKKLNHKWEEEGHVHAPTCTTDGYTEYRCTNEGCTETKKEDSVKFEDVAYYNSVEDAQKSHTGFDVASKTVFRNGTCKIIGLYKYQCKDCGKYVLVVIDGTGKGHVDPGEYDADKGEHAGKEATCTEAGYTAAYTCSVCGEFVESKPVEALQHSWLKEEGKAATCKSAGQKPLWTCEHCGDVHETNNGEVIPQLEHQWEDIAEIPATCTKAGTSAYKKCSVCGAIEGRSTIPAINHKNREITDERAASCEEYGYKHHVCPDCGDEYIEKYVPAFGHEMKKDEASSVAPTCEQDGKDVKVCSHAGCKHTESTTVPALGHKNKAGQTIVNDCQDQTTDRFCVNCKHTVGKAHNDVFEVFVEATCKEYGYYLEVCRNCGESKVTDIDDSHLGGHTRGKWELNVAPTFTSEGSEKHVCSVCGAEESRSVPALVGALYSMEIDNATVSGANYADSSLISVKVSIESSKIDVWGILFNVNYDSDVLAFESAEFLSKNFITNPIANDNGGYVTVVASAPNGTDKKAQNVTIEGVEEVVVLYFRVISPKAVETVLSFDRLETINASRETVYSTGISAGLSVDQFLDINGDRDVNLADALALYEMVIGAEGSADYDATVDIDCDGEITLNDLLLLYQYMAGVISYDELVGRTEA